MPQISRREALLAAGAASLSVATRTSSLAALSQGRADEWWSWRGPLGNNHATSGPGLFRSLAEAKVQWAVSIPGRGHSSPIVVGNRVYLTTADKAAGTQSVVAVDRAGKLAWVKEVYRGGIPAENHPKNTEASPTVAFDGEGLLVSFYNDDAIRLTRLSIDGSIDWQKNIGTYRPDKYKYGYAASPLLYQDLVIIAGDFDGQAFLAAHDRLTGEQRWKVERPGMISFSSPIVAKLQGKDQLLLSGCEMVAAYDPASGQLLWKTPQATTMATCGTMVWEGNLVFASGGYPKSQTVAIAADTGRLVWSNRVKCYEQSMVVKDGYLFGVADSGVAYCWRCTDGKAMWKERLGGKYSSSPILVGDVIHVFNEAGQGFSFLASPDQYAATGQTKLGDEAFASPVVVDNTMFLRVAETKSRRQESLLLLA